MSRFSLRFELQSNRAIFQQVRSQVVIRVDKIVDVNLTCSHRYHTVDLSESKASTIANRPHCRDDL